MKSSLLLLAAFLGAATVASAQTAIPQTAPNTSTPSTVPSGMPASTTTNSVGPVSSGEVFTKGDPANQKMRDRRAKNSSKMKGQRKTKTDMQ